MRVDDVFPEGFREELAAVLGPTGWVPFLYEGPDTVTFTLPRPGGFCAVVTAYAPAGSHSGPPLFASTWWGAGYEPATVLMPRLTLRPAPLLLPGVPATPPSAGTAEAESPEELDMNGDLNAFRDSILDSAQQAAVFTAAHASVQSMEAGLRAAAPDSLYVACQSLPVFLAATGQVAEALRLVEDQLDADVEDLPQPEYRRFARQLRLWAQAGSPLPPPLEAWPAGAFAPHQPERVSWREHRARSAAANDARDAVRRHAAGKSREELVAMLTAEYAHRGVQASAAAIVTQADLLQVRQQPFGRIRAGLAAAKMAATLTRGIVATFRGGADGPPAWMRPPEEAMFEVPADRGWVKVDIEPDAEAWLARVAAEAQPGGSLITQCRAWLRHSSEDDTVEVCLGERAVGQLRGPSTAMFAPLLAAAARYHELPVLTARLLWSRDDTATRSLEIARPAPVQHPPF